MKLALTLICALMMSLMVASVGFAGDDGSNTADYKAVPKAKHEKKFPSGHPATEQWLNHCYWVQAENLYFCKDDTWQ